MFRRWKGGSGAFTTIMMHPAVIERSTVLTSFLTISASSLNSSVSWISCKRTTRPNEWNYPEFIPYIDTNI